MNNPKILRDAATIVRNGWMQQMYYDRRTDKSCAMGSIGRAILHNEGQPVDLRAVLMAADADSARPMVDAVKSLIGNRHIIDWNDAPGQTAKNVAHTLELAAALLEEQEKNLINEQELVEA
jgi:hypothetical protein